MRRRHRSLWNCTGRERPWARRCSDWPAKRCLAYICLNELGERIRPAYLSNCFSRTLAQNGRLRHIRFHDLRHSNATLLLAHGIPLKQIQEWLGHSDFATTANIYAHLDVKSKERSAAVMEEALRLDGGSGAGKSARIFDE